MASREWFLTKITGALLGLALLISITVGAANLFFDLKREVVTVTERVDDHIKTEAEYRRELVEAMEKGDNANSAEVREIAEAMEKLVDLVYRKFDENEDEHDEMVSSLHDAELMIRDFTGLVEGMKQGQTDIKQEVLMNRAKIDGLYNPELGGD